MSAEAQCTGLAERFVADIPVCSPAITELAVSDSPYFSIDRLEQLVGSDPEFSLRVLAMANSAFYSQHEHIDTLRSALVILGDKMVQRLASGVFARSLAISSDQRSMVLWRHSIAVAVAARQIATLHRELVPERAHLVGLLHNIGRLGILRCEPGLYEEVTSVPLDQRADRERALFGCTQAELGTNIAVKMGLPGNLADAIRICARGTHHEHDDPLKATICLAHQLCVRSGHALEGAEEETGCIAGCVESLGLIEEDLETLSGRLDEQVETELALLAMGA